MVTKHTVNILTMSMSLNKICQMGYLLTYTRNNCNHVVCATSKASDQPAHTRDVFYVRRKVDLMKTAKVNAYIMHIFGKIELLSIHAT